MKDHATSNLNAISQAGSTYADVWMQYMQNLANLCVKENARITEQNQIELQAISQAKNPASVLQSVTNRMVVSANDSMTFALKVQMLGYQEQSNMLAAIRKQLAENSASWQSVIDNMPSGGISAGSGMVLNAVKSALDMGHHALETTQTTSKKTADMLKESLNGSGLFHLPSDGDAKSARKSAHA